MFCEKCGSQLGEGASFCFNCGAQVNTQHNNQSYQNQQVESQYMQGYQNPQIDPQYMQGYQNQQIDPQYMQGYQNQQMDPQYMQGYQNQQMDPQYMQGYQNQQMDPQYIQGYQNQQMDSQYMQGYQEQQMDIQYAQNDQQQYSLPQNGQVPPVKESKQKKERKKINLSKKSKIIIAVAAVVVIAVVVVVLMLPGNLLSPQRRIIDEYFDAINDKDVEAIYEIAYTDEILEIKGDGSDVDKMFFFTSWQRLGFQRGWYESNQIVNDVVKDSYPSMRDGLSEEEVTRKTLNMLDVSYEIVDIQPFEDFELIEEKFYSSGVEEEKVDMERLEEMASVSIFKEDGIQTTKVDIEDAYVAQVKIEWKYDDMLYGMDKDWWEDEAFCYYMEDYTYEDSIDIFRYDEAMNKENIYVLVLYKADGEWNILKAVYLDSLRTWYEEGKATLYRQ